MNTLSVTALALCVVLSACTPSTWSQIHANNARHAGHDHQHHYQALGDNAQNSLDWAGTYTGTFPCANCEGIETTLHLYQNKTYSLTERHIKNGRAIHSHTFEGRFDFNHPYHASLIRLDHRANKRVFFIGEGYAEARDRLSGQRLSNKLNYRLQQTKTH